MKKQFLSNYIKWKEPVTEERRILDEIEQAKAEIEIAASIFQNVGDPLLIELAIYTEKAAKKRYSYLIELAKKMNISVDRDYIIERCTRLAKV